MLQELHPVLEVLKQRLQQNSQPGSRTDPYKIGLAVEGGGMRGCVTAGGLRALHDLGIRYALPTLNKQPSALNTHTQNKTLNSQPLTPWLDGSRTC